MFPKPKGLEKTELTGNPLHFRNLTWLNIEYIVCYMYNVVATLLPNEHMSVKKEYRSWQDRTLLAAQIYVIEDVKLFLSKSILHI